jgi:AcrR family transcriptional regulator
MRVIAKASGLTVGNLYKYFKHKDDLFSSVVAPGYNIFKELFSRHDHSAGLLKLDLSDAKIKKLLDDIVAVFAAHRMELLIIIDGSEGTKYAKARESLLKLVETNLIFHLKSIRSLDKAYLPELSKVLSKGFMEGLFEILRKQNNTIKIRALILNYFAFFVHGFL